jgi:RHS repeat-associated protein
MDSESKKNSANHFLNTEGGKTKSNAIEIPSINLPKGGGAIKGIDEKFTVNAVNGTSSFGIELPVGASRGMAPSLTLTYSSGAGNGIFGLGWDLSLSSIKRKTDKGLPQYLDPQDSDTFLLSDAEDLVPEFQREADQSFSKDLEGNYVYKEQDSPDGLYRIRSYRPRIEGLFARIERWMEKTSGAFKWRVMNKNNSTVLYGWSSNSVIKDPQNPHRIYQWLPEFSFDDKGNCCHYQYKPEDASGFDKNHLPNKNRFKNGQITYTNMYLAKVLYGNKTPFKKLNDNYPPETDYLFQTIFDYGEYDANYQKTNNWDYRTDSFSNYKPGFELRTTRLCKGVLLFHYFDELPGGSALIKSMDLQYDTSSQRDFTYLKSATARGYIKKADGSYSSKSLPSTEFNYQQHDWSTEVQDITTEELTHAPAGLDQNYQFADLFNEGLSGMLTEQATGWYYKHNQGKGQFENATLISPKPSFTGLGKALQIADLNADGHKQIVSMGSQPSGYFELDDQDQWQPFQNFLNSLNINLDDLNMRMIDLNGDGKPDLLITEDNVFTWYESLGKDGYDASKRTIRATDEETGPAILFYDPLQTIFLADMSGDGMTDIVRIRNGEVCYWPNLGYGQFGAKVTMDNAPFLDFPDAFNPIYIKLADLDGSGTTDLIYLGRDKFSCWMNLSGNSFNNVPFETNAFPEIHNQANITVTDLLGNGLSCIVWSSNLPQYSNTPLRYIDLMNSKKPHLLIGYKNNLGKEVTIEYTPSTRFYIEDKLNGRPWITKLHFPVHCVSRTETLDKITGYRFSSSYKYHHGYYDHPEQEFRGFGMVEQTDTEQLEELDYHQPPVYTKNWFHTGAFLQKDNILNQFASEYWYEEMARQGFTVTNHENLLPDAPILPGPGIEPGFLDHLSGEEWCQALRTCKSMGLRTEVFALDAPLNNPNNDQIQQQLSPYSVTTHNVVLEMLQPKGQNKYAIFISKESESISYAYERATDDPRISHNLNIKLDEYGNILESASVVYPRKMSDASLPVETQNEQNKTHILYTLNQLSNSINETNNYRLALQTESQTFELKGLSKTSPYFALSDFNDILNLATEIPYTQIDSTPASPQKRCIEHIRSTYYKNNLSGPLPLHQLESLAIGYESYQLAFTPDLLTDIFGTKATDALLTEGKFTHSEGDNNWWIRSGITQYLNGSENQADAANRFYRPVSYTDPYSATTTVSYYGNYNLLVEQTKDALGNTTTVEAFNFRSLTPQRLRDTNQNLSEVITDELCLVKATAVYGKGTEADELSGLTEFSNPAENTLINQFFNATDGLQLTNTAKMLLHHATSCFVYDFDTYKNAGKPTVVATILREQHFKNNPDSPVQISLEYSSGIGSTVMKKVQAEPFRWIGNGRTVLNNKGNPVKQYEPYFSPTWHYEDAAELVETGVSPLMHYDPPGRLIKTTMPDETFSKVEFSSWKQSIYDTCDTILDSPWYTNRTNHLIDGLLIAQGKDPIKEKEAADQAALHANTPNILHFDTLGRPVLSIEHNRNPQTNADEFYNTKVKLDVEGNLRSITDARELPENSNKGNLVVQYKYDMLGHKVYQNSMDAGQRWLLSNCLGSPLRTWDERNHEFCYFYDVLQRPLYSKVLGGDGPQPLNHIFERIFYGESEPSPESKNLRGKMVKHYDTGGVVLTPEYDFKGQAIETTRQLFKSYKTVANWTDSNLHNDLETKEFTYKIETDALGRITQQTAPDGSISSPTYNRTGLLQSQSVKEPGSAIKIPYIKDIDYNEKGQRNKIIYGNNVITRFYYDTQTFRLNRLESKRLNNDPLQDWYYTFDPTGNVTHIEDKNVPKTFFGNEKTDGVSQYTYDALYRLIQATGRENKAALNYSTKDNWNDKAFIQQLNPGDPMAIRAYTQNYQYDQVGNIQQMTQLATGNNWTRNYEYEKTNNRLNNTKIGSTTYSYTAHPKHGFILNMPNLDVLSWNFKEELTSTIQQKVNPANGTAETTWYQYDAQGQRLRKITENSASAGATPSIKEERIYIGSYERYKKYSGTNTGLERVSLSIMDQQHRFALIDTRNDINDGTEKQLTRYQLHNHLGSAALELSDTAEVISYEEYHPFGTTAFQANSSAIKAAAKRYRYTGMERDEETGFGYHGSRYYLPWLGRWLSCDPIGIQGGINCYAYVKNNPIMQLDPTGKDGETCGVWDEETATCHADACPIQSSPEIEPPSPATPPRVSVRRRAVGPPVSHAAPPPPPPPPPPAEPTAADITNSLWQAAEADNYSDASVGALIDNVELNHTDPFIRSTSLSYATVRATVAVRAWDRGDYGTSILNYTVGIIECFHYATFGDTHAESAKNVVFTMVVSAGIGALGAAGGRPGLPAEPPPRPNPFAGLSEAEIDAAVSTVETTGPIHRVPASVTQTTTTPLSDFVPISRWGRPGLRPGDWVMPGSPNWLNYFFSFKWDPNPTNIRAPFASGEAFLVPPESVTWPRGWGLDGAFKGLFGQRVYTPAPPPPALPPAPRP